MPPIVLMYHSIGVERGFNNISISEFQEHLEWMNERYDLISLPGVLEDETADDKVAITFDDGLVSFFENVEPLISEYSIPATVYVLSSAIKQPNSITLNRIINDRLMSQDSLMTYKQLESLTESSLVTIGAHSNTHPILSTAIEHPTLSTIDTYEELEEEIIGSKAILESQLDISIDQFCFPYCIWDAKAYEIVSNTYSYAVQCEGIGRSSLITKNTDPHLIPRINAAVSPRKLKFLFSELNKYK